MNHVGAAMNSSADAVTPRRDVQRTAEALRSADSFAAEFRPQLERPTQAMCRPSLSSARDDGCLYISDSLYVSANFA
jgi:hypothetical protein